MRRISAVVAALLVALLVGAGIAYASVPGPGGVINGCRKNSDGSMRVIDSTATCPNGYTALNWRQAEPVTAQTSVGFNIDPGGVNGTNVVCPAGMVATGGGFFTDTNLPQLLPIGSFPLVQNGTTPSGWQVIFRNTGPDAVNASYTLYAICIGG
jgi:hypothetical protein